MNSLSYFLFTTIYPLRDSHLSRLFPSNRSRLHRSRMELPTTGPFLHVPVRFPALFPPLPQTGATAAPETQKGGRILLPPPSLQQLALLLLPDHRETVPKGLHGEVRFAENELVDDFRRKQRQPGRLRHHAGIDADGFRQRLDVGVSPIVDQRLPVESSGKIQQQGRITSQQVGLVSFAAIRFRPPCVLNVTGIEIRILPFRKISGFIFHKLLRDACHAAAFDVL